MSKYGELIKKARKQESQKTRKHKEEVIEQDVNLSIKVSAARRRHWAAEAKRQGTSLTAVIIESLSERFGEPD